MTATRVDPRRRAAGIAARAVAAIGGGYALASLAAVAFAVALPLGRADAVVTGMLASFAVHAAAVVWVFAAGSAARAWCGLLLASAALGAVAMLGRWHAAGDLLP